MSIVLYTCLVVYVTTLAYSVYLVVRYLGND